MNFQTVVQSSHSVHKFEILETHFSFLEELCLWKPWHTDQMGLSRDAWGLDREVANFGERKRNVCSLTETVVQKLEPENLLSVFLEYV